MSQVAKKETKSALTIFDILSIGIIILLVGVFYGRSLTTPLFGESASELFSHAVYCSNGFYINDIRPLKYVIYDTTFYLFGDRHLPLRLIFLSLYAVNAIIVFYVITKLTEKREIGLVSAVLFLSYWPNYEAAIWTATCHEILATFFFLLTVIWFWRFRESSKRRYYLLALFSYLLALASKETTIVLPAIILLIDLYRQDVRGIKSLFEKLNLWRTWLLPHIPFLIITAVTVYLLLHTVYVGMGAGSPSFGRIPYELYQRIGYLFSFPPDFHGAVSGYLTLFIIIAFIFMNPHMRNLKTIIFLFICILISLTPYLVLHISFRHFYLSSIASMTIMAIIIVEGLPLQKGSTKVAQLLSITLTVVLLSMNYSVVEKAVNYYNRNGKIYEDFLRTLTVAYPRGNEEGQIFYINFPWSMIPQSPITEVVLFQPPIAIGRGRHCQGTYLSLPISHNFPGTSAQTRREWSESNGFDIYKYYRLIDGKYLSPNDFDKISQAKKNTIFIFNPVREVVENVTGMCYKDLIALFTKSDIYR